MKTQAERFKEDRVAELKEFITQMRREYRDKCSPAEWERILWSMRNHLAKRIDGEYLRDP